jgi:hypothetical protein
VTNFRALHSVGNSLVEYLKSAYTAELQAEQACTFMQLSSGELLDTEGIGPAVSLFLYRVTPNEHLRNASRPGQGAGARPPLWLDLHYLLTAWADTALAEQYLIAWTMEQVHLHPVQDAAALTAEAGWSPGDYVQWAPADLGAEELMRVWDALQPPYRLSVGYIARGVRIGGAAPAGAPVVATRFRYADGVPEQEGP